jgi:hypothetical protein
MHLRTAIRSALCIALLAFFSSAGCSDVKDLYAFNSALQGQYGVPATIDLSGGGAHLKITFQNAPNSMVTADSSGLGSFRREVAIFTKRHYPKASRLEDVTIGFETVNYLGPITMKRRAAPSTFRLSELP